MRWVSAILALCWTAVGSAAGVRAASFSGKVIGVADGDTITVLRDGRPVKIRLHGVDCPEKGQPFGQKARQLTARLVFGKVVEVTVVDTDRYGRLVARVRTPSRVHRTPRDRSRPHRVVTVYRSLQGALLRAGLAWWYRRYAARDAELARLEKEARAGRRGLWADASPVPPWAWRRGKRSAGGHPAPKRNCFSHCMHQNTARAVAIEVIEADCARRCAAEGAGAPARRHPGSAAAGPVTPRAFFGNRRSKVVHAAGCRTLAACKHCTARFSSVEGAQQAGYRPHLACVRGASGRAARTQLSRQVGQRVRLVGRAAEAKAGSVIIPEGGGGPVYVKGLSGWSSLLGERVVVTGVLHRVKMIPDPAVDERGAISQGARGEQYVIEEARWQRTPRSRK